MWKIDGWQTPSDGKISHCLWQGQLKMSITLHLKCVQNSPFACSWVALFTSAENAIYGHLYSKKKDLFHKPFTANKTLYLGICIIKKGLFLFNCNVITNHCSPNQVEVSSPPLDSKHIKVTWFVFVNCSFLCFLVKFIDIAIVMVVKIHKNEWKMFFSKYKDS
jgi:hypothetical protein